MTDRVRTLIVSLSEDIRIDDVQSLIDAILHLRHVAAVTPEISNIEDWDARQKVRMELVDKMDKLFGEILEPHRKKF